MKKKQRLFLRLFVLLFIVLGLGSAFYTAYKYDDSPVRVGEPAPDFTLPTLDGETIKLSDFRGKGVFINFWGSWCTPCKREMPHMETQYYRFKDEGVEILAVNIKEPIVTVSSFVKRNGLTFPILLDRDGTVTKRYGIVPIPTSFFIDKEGIVVEKIEGEMSEEKIKQLMERIKPN